MATNVLSALFWSIFWSIFWNNSYNKVWRIVTLYVCVLKNVLKNCCKRKATNFTDVSEFRLQSLCKGSRKRRDALHKVLESSRSYRVHKLCLLEYTSTDHIKRYLKQNLSDDCGVGKAKGIVKK